MGSATPCEALASGKRLELRYDCYSRVVEVLRSEFPASVAGLCAFGKLVAAASTTNRSVGNLCDWMKVFPATSSTKNPWLLVQVIRGAIAP
jgi:hypothetical protein